MPEQYPDGNPKTVIGMSKPSVRAVPPVALFHLGAAMTDGETKYGRFNWREKRVTLSVYYDAIHRHLAGWWDGEDHAQDSGVHHLGHIMACCAILLDAASVGNLNDDRIAGPTPDLLANPYGGRLALRVAAKAVQDVAEGQERPRLDVDALVARFREAYAANTPADLKPEPVSREELLAQMVTDAGGGA